MFLNPWEIPKLVRSKERLLRQSKILEECSGLSQNLILKYAFVEACIFQSWFLEEGESSEHVLSMMNILAPLI